MAYYPGHPLDSTTGRFSIEASSIETVQDVITVDYATNGKLRQRGFYVIPPKSYAITHTLNTSDKATLLQFYLDNRFLVFNFYYKPDLSTHSSCMFTAPPTSTVLGGDFWSVSTSFSEAL